MDDLYRLAAVYQVKPAAFFEEDSAAAVESDKIQFFVDGLDDLTDSDRDRIVGYLSECSKALPNVPPDFAKKWIEGLKAVVAVIHNRETEFSPVPLSSVPSPSSGRGHRVARSARKTGICPAAKSARER